MGQQHKVLVLTSQLWVPPRNGLSLKSEGMIRAVSRVFPCDVVTFAHPGFDRSVVEAALPNTTVRLVLPLPASGTISRAIRSVGLTVRDGGPASATYLDARNISAIREILKTEAYSLIICDMLHSFPAIPRELHRKVLLSTNDSYSLALRNAVRAAMGFGHWAKQVARYWTYSWMEKRLVQRVAALHFVALQDKEHIERRYGCGKAVMIPNPIGEEYVREQVVDYGSNKVLLHADFNEAWHRDRVKWLAEKISRSGSILDWEWTLLGAGSAAVKALFPLRSRIDARDYVDDHAAFLARHAVGLYLERAGSGTKNRVIQHMAVGGCVVCSDEVLAGVPGAADGMNVIHAGDVNFIKVLTRTIENPKLKSDVGNRARLHVRRFFDRGSVEEEWLALVRRLIEGSARHVARASLAATRDCQ